jgi:hypothetical protein
MRRMIERIVMTVTTVTWQITWVYKAVVGSGRKQEPPMETSPQVKNELETPAQPSAREIHRSTGNHAGGDDMSAMVDVSHPDAISSNAGK